MRGLRRNLVQSLGGMVEENTLKKSAAGSSDHARKMRYLGYRVGADGLNIQQAKKKLKEVKK